MVRLVTGGSWHLAANSACLYHGWGRNCDGNTTRIKMHTSARILIVWFLLLLQVSCCCCKGCICIRFWYVFSTSMTSSRISCRLCASGLSLLMSPVSSAITAHTLHLPGAGKVEFISFLSLFLICYRNMLIGARTHTHTDTDTHRLAHTQGFTYIYNLQTLEKLVALSKNMSTVPKWMFVEVSK